MNEHTIANVSVDGVVRQTGQIEGAVVSLHLQAVKRIVLDGVAFDGSIDRGTRIGIDRDPETVTGDCIVQNTGRAGAGRIIGVEGRAGSGCQQNRGPAVVIGSVVNHQNVG